MLENNGAVTQARLRQNISIALLLALCNALQARQEATQPHRSLQAAILIHGQMSFLAPDIPYPRPQLVPPPPAPKPAAPAPEAPKPAPAAKEAPKAPAAPTAPKAEAPAAEKK